MSTYYRFPHATEPLRMHRDMQTVANRAYREGLQLDGLVAVEEGADRPLFNWERREAEIYRRECPE